MNIRIDFTNLFYITTNVILDILFIILIFCLSAAIRVKILPIFFSSMPTFKLNFEFLVFTTIVWILFLFYEGVYTKRLFFWDDVKILWKSSVIVSVMVFTFVSLTKNNEYVSRSVIIMAAFISIFLFPAYRYTLKMLYKKLNLKTTKIVVIGSKKTVFDVYRVIVSDVNVCRELKFFLVTDISKKRKIRNIILVPYKVGVERHIKLLKIDEVYICTNRMKLSILEKVVADFQMKVKNIFIIPDIKSFPMMNSEVHLVLQNQTFMLEIKSNLLNPIHRIIKDVFERLLAVVLIIIFLIPMVVIFLIIKLDSDGPAIFTQYRVGKNGIPFKIYKFRTMYVNSDDILKNFFVSNPEAKREFEKYWKIKNDPRVTRFGKFLRKTSLDELPQLFNVLIGDMNLIGPRPYLPEEVKFLGESANIIFNVKPGITGLWQVSGRNDKDYESRIALDVWYIRNWSLWVDLIILVKTAAIIISRKGAY